MPEINETREENWVAALCHLSVLLQLVGMVIPLVVYLTQKDRSSRLRFQALQALIYQGIGFLAYLVYLFILLAGWFSMLFFTILSQPDYTGQVNMGLLAIPASFLLIFVLLVGAIIVPAYFILALVGAWRNVKKGEFRYPLLGGWVQSLFKISA